MADIACSQVISLNAALAKSLIVKYRTCFPRSIISTLKHKSWNAVYFHVTLPDGIFLCTWIHLAIITTCCAKGRMNGAVCRILEFKRAARFFAFAQRPHSMPDRKLQILVTGLSVGRHLVQLLVKKYAIAENTLTADIIVADHSIPETMYLSTESLAALKRTKYHQINLNDAASVRRLFDLADGGVYDVVYNCCVDMKADQSDEFYKRFTLGQSMCVAEEAQRRGVGVFVHLGSGLDCVDPNGKEEAPQQAKSKQGKFIVELDERLRSMDNFNLIVVRPAAMYGPECRGFLVACYSVVAMMHRENVPLPPMLLDQRRDTAHVFDVARAMIHLAHWYKHAPKNEIYSATPLIFHVAGYTGILCNVFPCFILTRCEDAC